MKQNKMLGINIEKQLKIEVLEKIKKYTSEPADFFHIVSLNPENLVLTTEDKQFKEIVETAQIKLIDGVGVALAGRLLGIGIGERITGVGLMEELLRLAGDRRLTVLLVGGSHNLALRLAQCYQQLYPQANFRGIEGIRNIQKPALEEENKIFSIVSAMKPNLMFMAFGSPYQEKWLWNNRTALKGIICMGVGGAFDYLGGNIRRAPKVFQLLGLEWLYRLLNQPWRWKRQLRLLKFISLVIKEKLHE